MSRYTFVKICPDNPERAIWQDEETGEERIYAPPKRLRARCAYRGTNGVSCRSFVKAGSPYCGQHLNLMASRQIAISEGDDGSNPFREE